jgi:hypothetical protein
MGKALLTHALGIEILDSVCHDPIDPCDTWRRHGSGELHDAARRLLGSEHQLDPCRVERIR